MAGQNAYEMFMEFLRELGYEAEGSDWGSEKALIVFLHNGLPFCIVITKNDEQLFEMTHPFSSIDPGNPEEMAHALNVCVTISRETKVVKVYLIEGLLIGAVEMFCSPLSQSKVVFSRCLQTLADATARFEEEMKKRPAGGGTRSLRTGLASSISTPILDELMRRGPALRSPAASPGLGQWRQTIAQLKKRDPGRR
jgi:hypothetical protein